MMPRLNKRVRILALLFLLQNMISTAAPVCPAGTAVGYFRLEVRRPGAEYGIPIDRVNRVKKGDTVIFFPSDPPVPTDVSGSRVALLLLTPQTGELRLLETKKGDGRQEWVLPDDAETIGIAYGPKGLDEVKMKRAAVKDPELVAQLADYSEKTAQTEIVLSALSGRRQNDDRAMESALAGLASTGGGAKLDRNASLDQQTMTLFRTLNPAIGAYDPLAPEPQQRWQQSAMLASSVAGLFFGNTVGLAGGGAALFLNMRTILFPKTELRSALLREAPEAALCAAKSTASRTRFAYLWARKLPGGAPPAMTLPRPGHMALGLPAVLPVEAREADLTAAARAFRWKLIDEVGAEHEVAVNLPANEKTVRLAPAPKKAGPGRYKLVADWDWNRITVDGEIHIHAVPDIAELRLETESADRLVTNSGPVRARLSGATTHFVSGLHLLRQNDALAKPIALTFAPGPDGNWLEFEVNTTGLPTGAYSLTIAQQGGAKAEIPVAIQPPTPALANLPIRLHEGETARVRLAGQGIERIEKLTSKYAQIDWDPDNRTAAFTLAAKPPAEIDIEAHVAGRHHPLRFAAALRALGPKPEIVSVTRASQQAGPVERREGEIDNALPAAFSLQVRNVPAGAEVKLHCREDKGTPQGESRALGPETIYLTVPANGPAPCELLASIGESNPAVLGRTVALPVVTAFELTSEPGAVEGTFKGTLRGRGLESIARTGWSEENSVEVTGLPAPDGAEQKLEIVMPWPAPAPHAPLRIWLRGESDSRLTTARY
jgi:hypothetical protein